MLKPRYILKKDSPELKKGAVLEFAELYPFTGDGYICEDTDYIVFKNNVIADVFYSKDVVETQPEWFEKISPAWLSDEQLKKLNKILGLGNSAPKKDKTK